MSQLIISDVDERTLDVLRQRADRNGRTVEAEARHILAEVARPHPAKVWAAIDAFRQRLASTGRDFGDSTLDIREDRDR